MATETVPPRKTGRRGTFLLLFLTSLAIIIVISFAISVSVNQFWRETMRQEITRDLTAKARMFAAAVDTDRIHKITDIAAQEGQFAGARATVIDVNGKVIADSEIPVANLEGEGKRPEFAAALRGQTGIESRKRNLFGIPVLYVAVPVPGGAVRLGYPLADIDIALEHARKVLLLGIAVATAGALLISDVGSRVIQRHESDTVASRSRRLCPNLRRRCAACRA
jgi:two-component system phosphate regulon sensor histidine kinase PhoR